MLDDRVIRYGDDNLTLYIVPLRRTDGGAVGCSRLLLLAVSGDSDGFPGFDLLLQALNPVHDEVERVAT